MEFIVSVIIPVYNAEKYVQKAVESAVTLSEVGEVILIEDHSPDNALQVCQDLANKHANVRLYRHPNGENKGAAASRNLGIQKAKYDYIAFLDADDFYLPNRFKADKEIFRDLSIDGVYSAALNVRIDDPHFKHVHTIKRKIRPDKLLHYLIRGTYGHFCTNGITLKKSLLLKTGGFNETLRLHQDTELWVRCASKGTLVAGSINEPTSIIVSHGQNRVTSSSKKSRLKYLLSLINRFSIVEIGLINYALLLRKAAKNTETVKDYLKIITRLK
ncbi:glycosyltransferase family 2 protein [Pontibacter lucknowensis]|uniref:Glycosyl transferase family 2 n=1 Tax=Pontibacter lucknowensis TaxID=1077936 RepID=A0A1N6Y7A3_9BACT|nr:glycosyltransferase family 2 protein [Pontibacter lucknowensis]SIR10448.1 Glycosyl transferase family 2 [Pontibacter lucknowensis]